MELQGDTGRIILTYYAKSINIIAGGKGGGVVSKMKERRRRDGAHINISTTFWARIYHLMVVSELTDNGCII